MDVQKQQTFPVGLICDNLTDNKLPSRRQVLAVFFLFFFITAKISSYLKSCIKSALDDVDNFWEDARIRRRQLDLKKKKELLHGEWKLLTQKTNRRRN